TFKVTLTRKAKAVELKMTGSAASAKEARAFVEGVETLKKQASDGLKKIPEEFKGKIKAKTIDGMQTALKNVKVEAKDALLPGSATISYEAIRAVGEFLPLLYIGRGFKEAPPPAIKNG